MVANLKDIPCHRYTLEEYFALERIGSARYEFWDGDIVCMSGGSSPHAEISGNVYFSLRQKLTSSNCKAYNSELAIKTPKLPPYRYPDASVVCGQTSLDKIEGFDTITNPVVIIEVMSATTENKDRNKKRLAYQALPSLQEYLLIAQDEPHVTQYTRQGNFWPRKDFADLEVKIVLAAINCELSLREIYEGIIFS